MRINALTTPASPNPKSLLMNGISFVLGKIAPGWAQSKIESLMLAPKNKLSRKIKLPKNFKSTTISTREGKLQGYQTGKGPMVVFIHGWGGGAYQFFPLMRGLSGCGFSSLAFDHIGHGQSEKRATSLHRFVSTTNDVLKIVREKSPGGLAAIVGHSMGCIAVANAMPSLIRDIPLFFVSPVFNYRTYFLKKVRGLGLHASLIKQYEQTFEESYRSHFEKMELSKKLVDYSNQTEIVHDENDAESNIDDVVKFCTTYPLTKLQTTRGYGHERVLTCEAVWHQLKSHLNYEDTTQNLFRKQVSESQSQS